MSDPRTEALVPGVANRDARAVCDAMVARMLEARDRDDREALARGLAEAFRTGLWRGQNLVSFDALLQDVLGLTVREGRELAQAGATACGTPLVRADDRLIATWFRATSALLPGNGTEHENRENRVELLGDGPTAEIIVRLTGDFADLWLAEIGKRVAPVAKFLPSTSSSQRRPPQR